MIFGVTSAPLAISNLTTSNLSFLAAKNNGDNPIYNIINNNNYNNNNNNNNKIIKKMKT